MGSRIVPASAGRFVNHRALDSLPPHGDILYGLLVGSGRIDEALAAMRRDGDPAGPIDMEFEKISHGISKRSAAALRKREEAHLQALRQHLAMLEAALGRRAGA